MNKVSPAVIEGITVEAQRLLVLLPSEEQKRDASILRSYSELIQNEDEQTSIGRLFEVLARMKRRIASRTVADAEELCELIRDIPPIDSKGRLYSAALELRRLVTPPIRDSAPIEVEAKPAA